MILEEHTRQTIAQWLARELSTVSPTNPEHRHLDELVGADWRSFDVVALTVAMFRELATQVSALGTPVKPISVIPLLTLGKGLTAQVPTSEDLPEQVDQMEPPSLYLVSWDELHQAVVCEEYCRPLDLFSDLVDDHFYVYYREYRYGLAYCHDWEYARAVYLEYYPQGRRLQ